MVGESWVSHVFEKLIEFSSFLSLTFFSLNRSLLWHTFWIVVDLVCWCWKLWLRILFDSWSCCSISRVTPFLLLYRLTLYLCLYTFLPFLPMSRVWMLSFPDFLQRNFESVSLVFLGMHSSVWYALVFFQIVFFRLDRCLLNLRILESFILFLWFYRWYSWFWLCLFRCSLWRRRLR